MLLRYFTARSRDATVAEDIVQEIYLKLEALEADYVIDNPTAFLFRTGTNIWLNRIRGAGRDRKRNGQWLDVHHVSLGVDLIADEPSADAQISAKQQLTLIKQALLDLPDKTQHVFNLRKIEGLDQAEVMSRLGMSKSSVQKHLASAIAHITARVNPERGP